MKTIGFWDNQLGEMGTTVSTYDYAHYNEEILGNKSVIMYNKDHSFNHNKVIDKFKNRFEYVYPTNDFKEVDDILKEHNIDIIYIIKGGEKDHRLSKVAKNCVHCVFNCYQKHGEIYSAISSWIRGNDGKYPVVPHMINLPKHNNNLREKLNIPKNAVVFGGYGGKGSFAIPYVHSVVYNVAKSNPNIYFLFANFPQFCPSLQNIIHMDTIVDLNEKTTFINTCDAMIHAKNIGETFGIAMGEFSTLNKPIICSAFGHDQVHTHILGEKAFWYSNPENLTSILLNFNPEIEKQKDWNCFKEYTPEKVMKIFNDVYLS